MGRPKILVVDDEEDILELVKYNLVKEGYLVSCAETGEKALSLIQANLPDLIVLDLMLPGIDGLEVARLLDANALTRKIPIVMLTAKTEEADIVAGLELGADDYITKPFSPRILVARVRAVLRRKNSAKLDNTSIIRIHDLVVHPGHRRVLVKDKPVQLTLAEFGILHHLAKTPVWVFTRSQIVDAVHGEIDDRRAP